MRSPRGSVVLVILSAAKDPRIAGSRIHLPIPANTEWEEPRRNVKLHPMFTPSEREAIRTAILALAKADTRITGGAITGSKSLGNEDAWSDIDLAFGVRTGTTLAEVLADYTVHMEQANGAVHWFDVPSGAWIYRVFLLPNTLQVDLAFAPEAEFGARASSFHLEFGSAAKLPSVKAPQTEDAIGMAWLYALHARSSLARNRLWQAEYFVSAMRNQALTLACLRLGLPHRDGRGYDRLPAEALSTLVDAFAARIESTAIRSAFQSATHALMDETAHRDPVLAARLEGPLRELAGFE